jgi:hypothetical protein
MCYIDPKPQIDEEVIMGGWNYFEDNPSPRADWNYGPGDYDEGPDPSDYREDFSGPAQGVAAEDSARYPYPDETNVPDLGGYRDQWGTWNPGGEEAWAERQEDLAHADEQSGYNWGPPPPSDEPAPEERRFARAATYAESYRRQAAERRKLQDPHYTDYSPEENDWEHQAEHEREPSVLDLPIALWALGK